MKIVGVIPARYASSRFPGKPLADICGKPMIWWVYHNAMKVKKLNEIYVATDDARIEEVCRNYEIPVIMTSTNHINGTERLSEVASKIVSDIYVTIQGDEPLLEEATISAAIDIILSDERIPCATLKTPYNDPVDVINSTTPKVVSDLNNNVLIFTRSPVPYPKAALSYVIYKPIGVYAFRRDALLLYSNLVIGPLEHIEEIELLRFIEHGIKIKIGIVHSETIAVDTEKDLERVREYMRNNIVKH